VCGEIPFGLVDLELVHLMSDQNIVNIGSDDWPNELKLNLRHAFVCCA
jgi:hypothetical protein